MELLGVAARYHGLAELTPGRFVTEWRVDPAVAGVVVVLGAGYLAAVLRLRAAGRRWPLGRTLAFLGLGLGSLVGVTMSSLTVYEKTLFWPVAVQYTILLAVTPIGLGLGDPIGLVRNAFPGRPAAALRRALASRGVRALTFPFVSAVLAVVTTFAVYFTPYFTAALHHPVVHDLLELQLVVTGCLFALPLLGVELLPSWCTHPVRLAIAVLDGLLDAVPGIVVMSGPLIAGSYYQGLGRPWGPSVHWDQTIGGALILTLSELVAIPFLAALFFAWARTDAAEAAAADVVLDALAGGEGELPARTRPWWEVDPGPLADRAA
ncbi:MAG TPA: cytochrome c oxidase assembly protein, partial [Mycobacteriales bacterium]|nr:cytochrome c oxidase assembly protein [Mycobacteriales bacterium]